MRMAEMTSAEDRIHAVHAEAELRKLKAAVEKGKRERTRHALFAFLGYLLLALVLIVGIQQGLVPIAINAVTVRGDPKADQFEQTRAAQIRMPVKGETCREVSFDNNSGRFSGGNTAPCNPSPEAVQRGTAGTGRINAIRDSFAR
jgi:hypothetical protein